MELPCSAAPIIRAPTAYRKSHCFIKSFSTSARGFVVRNEENHALQIVSPRSLRALFSFSGSRGYLLPTSLPSNPASAISEIHCSKGISPPSSGISSLVQPIGAMANRMSFSIIAPPESFFELRIFVPCPALLSSLGLLLQLLDCSKPRQCPRATRTRILAS